MFEAYKIGIKLSLLDGVTAGLLAMSGHFRTVSREVDTLQAKMARFKALGGFGLGATAAGVGILASIKPSIDAAMQYQQRIARMKQMGLTPSDMRSAEKAAWAVGRSVPTSSPTDALDTIMNLRMVFGDTADAIKNLPTVLRMEGVLNNAGLKGDQSYEIAKTLEMIGATKTPEMFNSYADAITKGIIASGGKVQSADYLSAVKYGRTAAQGWSKEFIEFYLPTLIQEMKSRGGSGGITGGPGNPLMSMYAAIVQGTVAQKSLGMFQKLGLVDPSKVVWTKSHMMRGVEPGGIKGWRDFMSNPVDWVQSYLMPALQKAGITDRQAQVQAISYLFQNRTAGFMGVQMAEQYWKFQRDRKLIEDTKGINNYSEIIKMSPSMQEKAIHARMSALKTVVGLQLVPLILTVLPKIVDFIQSIVNTAQAHPTALKLFIGFFAAIGALLAVVGTVTSFVASLGIISIAFPALAAGAGAVATAIGPVVLVLAGLAAAGAAVYGAYKWLTGDQNQKKPLSFAENVAANNLAPKTGLASTMASMMRSAKTSPVIAGGVSQQTAMHGAMTISPKIAPVVQLDDSDIMAASRYLPPSPEKSQHEIHTHVHLDGKKVAESVTNWQATAAAKPPSGPNQIMWGLGLNNPSLTSALR
jgi:hypothetical protein